MQAQLSAIPETLVTKPIVIRPYLPADRTQIFWLLPRLASTYPGGLEWLDGKLHAARDGLVTCLVATLANRAIGVLIESPKGARAAKLSTLAVAAPFRRLQIGTQLVAIRKSVWCMNEIEKIHVTMEADLAPSVGPFFARFGFTETAWCVDRYGPGRDELVMSWRPDSGHEA